MLLKLDRPLAFFDIESTGTSPRGDRIIDLAVTKLFPDGERRTYTYRVNPEMPIPEGSTRIHGITDDDVRESPTFKEIAEKVCELLDDSDLAGYNIVRFDVPMLQEEFKRAGVTFDTESRRMIDVQRIFHRKEPRDLSAALSFYCGEMHMGAHGAEDDVLATIRVLEGQYDKYNDLPTDPDALHDYCNPKDPDWVDRTGRLRWENGQVSINFGKNKGRPLADLVRNDPNFIKWMLRSDFPQDTRLIVENAMNGTWPERPKPSNGIQPAE
ncbi:MAG: ribonuclease H-like domain-containing protein [Kiritimatiellae bacterium]|nr:ribonuclease H-like domain-containing protein [Kiritimatiellia bacterium]